MANWWWILTVPVESPIAMLRLAIGEGVYPRMQDALNRAQTAIDRLKGVGALDSDCDLTPLGFHLASLPVDVRVGKLLLFGAIFRCLDASLTIAAALRQVSRAMLFETITLIQI